MKASFIHRFGAYLIDILIIGTILSIICYRLPNNEETEETITSLNQKYISGEITSDEYYTNYNNLFYENQKNTILTTGISAGLTIAYFVIFQFMNKGQTIGKKIFNIRVVDTETKKAPSLIKFFLRSIIILRILSKITSLILINTVTQKTYISCYLSINTIEIIFIFISFIMILTKKEGLGLHDIITKTTVIEERR